MADTQFAVELFENKSKLLIPVITAINRYDFQLYISFKPQYVSEP